MEKNQVSVIKIEKLGMNGEGVARANNEVVFVPFALPNEQVKCKCINAKNKFAIMKVEEIISSSPDREAPPCPYFKKCGGCDIQHLIYNKQLEFKTNLVKETLLKVGNIDYDVEPCEFSKNQYNYRNKASFPIVLDDGYKIGMYRVNSHNLVDIDYCYLQKDDINKVLRITKQWLNSVYSSITQNINDTESYYQDNTLFKSSRKDIVNKNFINDTKSQYGRLKHLVIRNIDDKLLITLVATNDNIFKIDEYIDLLKENFSDFGLNININTKDNNVILSNKYTHIYGNKDLSFVSDEIKLKITNASFYQVNDYIKDKIYEDVKNAVKDDVVIDAFSGAGLLTAKLSTKAKKVYGIEIVEDAVKSANQLMKDNNINNVQNICGDCTKELPKLIENIKGQVSVVLDPPRKGCDRKVLESLLKCKPNKIIYIACSPISLSRDAKILVESGLYKITKVKPYDMFPQTKNVETLMILEKI